MNDPDNFLSRWSRRKREGDADKSRPQNSGEQANPIPRSEQPVVKDDAGAPPEFDLASLPSIDSIGAGTDISAFMKKGVPSALRHAALRRAWSADPAIRDFMGPTENYWDAVGPDGIPGFGDLDPGLDIKRMVSELFGEAAPDKGEPEQNEVANAPAQIVENFEVTDDHNQAADRAQQSAPQQSEYGAMQKQPAEEPAKQKVTRRHGGAMPE